MTITARNEVGDVETFLAGHQERLALFAPAVSAWSTFQDTDNPKSVVMTIDVTDMDKFATILQDPRNEVLKARHTVIDSIIISLPAAGTP